MPAYKPIRRSQLISPFGIGAMVDFPKDESLMPAGLDAWMYARVACPADSDWEIREERLEARLNVTHFRQPPEHRDGGKGVTLANIDVPFVRFPRWHYCHHCGAMHQLSLFSPTQQRCPGREYPQQSCHKKIERRRPFLIPVRFVAVCQRGHIQDFPFMEFVHRDQPFDATHNLRLRGGRSSAGLTGIRIECSCGASRVLGDVFQFDENQGGPLSKPPLRYLCRGQRPWLGEQDTGEGCGEHLRVLQRGASNVYFSLVVSSLYLPLWAEKTGDRRIVDALEEPRVWRMVAQGTLGGKIDIERCKMAAELLGLDAEALRGAAQRKFDGSPVAARLAGLDEEQFRQAEYDALCQARGTENADLLVRKTDISNYKTNAARFFQRIHLVHKLRETRVLAGFTRVFPPDGSAQGPRVQRLKSDSETIDWLPAIKVFGEGIFFELNFETVERWLTLNPTIKARITPLNSTYNANRQKRHQSTRAVTARFVLLHTLTHVLINQLSFDCGYGSAALRERLFCNFAHPEVPMLGALIYTASGDSEGTMGGLVRMGQPGRFEATLRRAIARAAWCSSDPVCIESNGQGSDSANLAACHGCCLLPETSCEEGNRLLDRALLVGTPEYPNLGYFISLLT